MRRRRPRVGSDTEKEIHSYQIDPNTPITGDEETLEVTPTTTRSPTSAAPRRGEKNPLAETINTESVDLGVKKPPSPLAQSINVENPEIEVEIEVEIDGEKPIKSFTGTLPLLPRR